MLSVGVIIAAGALAAAALVRSSPHGNTYVAPVQAAVPATSEAATVMGNGAAQSVTQANLKSALAAQDWPDLNMASGWDEWASNSIEGGSCVKRDSGVQVCSFGDSQPKKAVLLGDSVAQSWIPGLRSQLEASGYQLILVNRAGCSFADARFQEDGQSLPPNAECQAARADEINAANENSPELVLISEVPSRVETLEGSDGPNAEAYAAGLVKSASRIWAPDRRIAYVDGPPGGKSLKICKTALSSPADCVVPVSESSRAMADASNMFVSGMRDQGKPVAKVGTADLFCVSDQCPSFSGETPIYADGEHPATEYSRSLGAELYGRVKAALQS